MLKHLLFAILLLATKHLSLAQAKVSVRTDEIIYMEIEKMPQYPGGMQALEYFLEQRIQYPAEAQQKAVTGTVFVSFVVDSTGLVKDAKILKGIGQGCDEEALRVVKLLPAWKPGQQDGAPVNVRYSLPVAFIL